MLGLECSIVSFVANGNVPECNRLNQNGPDWLTQTHSNHDANLSNQRVSCQGRKYGNDHWQQDTDTETETDRWIHTQNHSTAVVAEESGVQ